MQTEPNELSSTFIDFLGSAFALVIPHVTEKYLHMESAGSSLLSQWKTGRLEQLASKVQSYC